MFPQKPVHFYSTNPLRLIKRRVNARTMTSYAQYLRYGLERSFRLSTTPLVYLASRSHDCREVRKQLSAALTGLASLIGLERAKLRLSSSVGGHDDVVRVEHHQRFDCLFFAQEAGQA